MHLCHVRHRQNAWPLPSQLAATWRWSVMSQSQHWHISASCICLQPWLCAQAWRLPVTSSLCLFGSEVRLVMLIDALLPWSKFVYLAYCHLRPCPHAPDTCTRAAAPQVCLHARSVFYHLVVWAWCHSKQPSLIDPATSWECITPKHTDIVGEKKNWMRSWSPPRQEMRTLQPWKIH